MPHGDRSLTSIIQIALASMTSSLLPTLTHHWHLLMLSSGS